MSTRVRCSPGWNARALASITGDGRGASAARNLGAGALSSVEYLVWLDADDTLEPQYFEIAGARLDAEPGIDFVSSAMRAFEGASYVWKPSSPTFVEAIATGGVPHASTLLRRQVWETVGGFDENLQSFELLDFWASAIEHGFRGRHSGTSRSSTTACGPAPATDGPSSLTHIWPGFDTSTRSIVPPSNVTDWS